MYFSRLKLSGWCIFLKERASVRLTITRSVGSKLLTLLIPSTVRRERDVWGWTVFAIHASHEADVSRDVNTIAVKKHDEIVLILN